MGKGQVGFDEIMVIFVQLPKGTGWLKYGLGLKILRVEFFLILEPIISFEWSLGVSQTMIGHRWAIVVSWFVTFELENLTNHHDITIRGGLNPIRTI